MKLSNICTLKSGFQGKTTEGNEFKQIRLKDVTKDGVIKYEELENFNSEKVNEKYLLKKGDIILKAKSGDNTAAIIEEDLRNIVSASHFIVIAVNDIRILNPEYLVMYLNSECAQDYLKKHAEGTALPIVKIKTLEELDVKVIDLEKQKELADMYKLIKEEKLTMEQLIENRSKQFKAYLREVLD
ncbi:restriction endonuclease subunit S [Clostridium gasigenes]|uniref:restriction endonuclease subunit S n=1 Tax=Clostridium gasigenes TaxID=94869 RepID=UPI001C0AB8BF|nr:restriction endonuclease subunit S [Clostridium gasigenes]MBU3135575.1 restriction endonuclease subunit S [Clostridium gasigenes]